MWGLLQTKEETRKRLRDGHYDANALLASDSTLWELWANIVNARHHFGTKVSQSPSITQRSAVEMYAATLEDILKKIPANSLHTVEELARKIHSAVPSLVQQLPRDHELRNHLPSDTSADPDQASSNGAGKEDLISGSDSPKFTSVRNNRSSNMLSSYQSTTKPTEVIDSLQKAVVADPDAIDAHFKLCREALKGYEAFTDLLLEMLVESRNNNERGGNTSSEEKKPKVQPRKAHATLSKPLPRRGAFEKIQYNALE
jgi:hypothetical protein